MLPERWEKHSVGKLCTSIVPGRNKPKTFEGNIPWVTTPEISGRYLPSKLQKNYVCENAIKEAGAKIVPTGSVIIAAVGDLGLTAIALEPIVLNQQLHAFVCKENINNEYLAYWLETQKTYMNSVASKTTIPYMNKTNCESIPVVVPPLPEQKKIAKILSTWDKAISTTEQLLANSQQQKKALMQQLLTGKKRFQGGVLSDTVQKTKYGALPFDWKFLKIEDIAQHVSEKNKGAEEYPVLSCSKYDGFVDSLKYFKKQVYSEDTSGYKIIRLGWFGFPANHIEEGSIGLQNFYETGIVSPIYITFVCNKNLICNEFLYALFKTEHYRQIFAASTNASVDRRGSLRWNEFGKIKVPVPSLKEQQKIAAVLSAADHEIEALQQKLNYLKQEKKALMQVLLTGKCRVKIEAAA